METRRPYVLIYIGYFDLSVDDGKSINEREFISELLHRNHIRVIYIGPKPAKRLQLSPDLTIMDNTLKKSVGSQLRYQLRLFGLLWRLFRRYRGRIVVCTRPNYASVAPLLFSKLTRTPFVVKFAGLSTILDERPNFGVQRNIAKAIYALNAGFADRLWVVTENIGKWWEQKIRVSPSKIFTLPNGVNTNRFNLDNTLKLPTDIQDKIPLARYYIGYAGGLRKILGIDLLMDAAEDLLREGRDYAFLIAGSGEYQETLKRMLIKKGLQDRFILMGMMPYDLMPAFYRACDLLVAPFTQDFVKAYGSSSQKIYQYLSCGKPVLAAKTEDHAFIARERLGEVVTSEDTVALAAAIRRLLEPSGTLSAEARHNYVKKERSYEKIVDRFIGQMDSLWRLKSGR